MIGEEINFSNHTGNIIGKDILYSRSLTDEMINQVHSNKD